MKDRMKMSSRFLRAIVLATWLYSLLFWAYIVARLIFTTSITVKPDDPFIYWIPSLTFFNLGILAFIVSLLSMIIYLTLWGRDREAQ